MPGLNESLKSSTTLALGPGVVWDAPIAAKRPSRERTYSILFSPDVQERVRPPLQKGQGLMLSCGHRLSVPSFRSCRLAAGGNADDMASRDA